MRGKAFILIAAVIAAFFGCQTEEGLEIPAQEYLNTFEAGEQEQGGLFGKILFPSEYNQRSLAFSLDNRNFFTQPDGRFLLEGVPAGERLLRVHVKGFEAVEQIIIVGSDELEPVGDILLAMARGKVLGRLVNEAGSSVPGISIRLAPLGGVSVSDKDGIFQFIGVGGGRHILRVTDPTVFTFDRTLTIYAGEQRNLGNIQVFHRAVDISPRTARMIEK